ncbi:MAG: DUF1343 domain-containing protein [Phycisphaerae bacterium]|nr:DUF1343 domain-containing protein [Phycisphaerae bacterium]
MSLLHVRLLATLVVSGTLLSVAVAKAELPFETQYAQLKQVLKGKRVGLVTGPTAVDTQYRLLADRLHADADVTLVCFFAPEHGLRDELQAGADVQDYVDEVTGLPVYSVYGSRQAPLPEHLALLDVLLCDIQDVGARFFTRIETMTLAMEAAAKAGKAFVVFDRPNPIGLTKMEGPPLPMDAGLIGRLWPGQPFGLPTRTGLTMGEIATLVNNEWTEHKADLTVVKVPGYTRSMSFAETGYPWVMASPNMPTIETAFVYTGTCIFEGANISEGRGTTRPFELIGAPFVNASKLAETLNAIGLKGVRFRPAWFTPTFDDYRGKCCAGVQVHVLDREALEPVRVGLTMLKVFCELYPKEVVVRNSAARLMGIPNLHERIWTESVDALIQEWQPNLEKLRALVKPHLLYP